jgi:phospholipid/cholesterol/gamma-HCH transport system substrate-binding protein
MRISHRILPRLRLTSLAAFVAVCALVFGYLWINSGGRLPAVSSDGYQVSLDMPHVSNLVYDSDVMIAGVKVGKVSALGVENDHARVTMRLNSNAPLHQGAIVQVRQKTLVEETYLEITDGKGTVIPDHASLPTGTGKSATNLNDILVSLDKPTRKALGSLVKELGAVTKGSRTSISSALSGLGDVGEQGKDVLSALASQSGDLKQLSVSATALLAALNTRQGEIAQLVTNADALSKATADRGGDVALAMKQLPDLLTTAKSAGASLQSLGTNLQPVAANLRAAAPDLTAALDELPKTAEDLRAVLPSLNSVLDDAPATLRLIPRTASTVEKLIPGLRVVLSDLNPMLGYLEPYGHDLAAFFTNFGQTLATGDANGKAFRVFGIFNEQSLKNLPINTNIGPLNKFNPYPAAGGSADPGPWNRTYPRVNAEPMK